MDLLEYLTLSKFMESDSRPSKPFSDRKAHSQLVHFGIYSFQFSVHTYITLIGFCNCYHSLYQTEIVMFTAV